MSVLQREALEQSPLGDLHALASELGIEGYRRLRRPELISAILSASGGEAGGGEAEAPAGGGDEGDARASTADSGRGGAGDGEEGHAVEEAPRPRRARRGRRTRAAGPRSDDEPLPGAEEPEAALEQEPEEEREPAEERAPEEVRLGVLHLLGNGSGLLRADAFAVSPHDVYVSPAQVRRCELRPGDEVAGPVRPARRSERHPSLVRVETVNGAPAEPPQERPRFEELTPVFATERLSAPEGLDAVPFGKGSRVAVAGAPGAGASTVLRTIVATLAERHPDLELTVVLAGVRPEEVTDWRRVAVAPVAGGGLEPEENAPVAEMAVERAKRAVEQGRDAAVVIDRLDALPGDAARRVFAAARNTEEAGALTVIASTGMSAEPLKLATTRIALEPPLESAPEGEALRVVAAGSLTLRADLLGT